MKEQLRTRFQSQVIAVVYVAAMFMTILDTTIVNVALPSLGRDLGVGAEGVGVVSISYLVSLTVFIPVSGWLGDRIGGRRALLGAIGLFTLGSALCGVSTSIGELTAFRILQGAGGAVMTPVGLAMLFRAYPPAERVRVSSVLAIVMGLAPALGPILGGVLTTFASWRWVFLVNVPLGLAIVLLGGLLLQRHDQPHPGRFDAAGFLLSGLGLGALMFGVAEGPHEGWGSPLVLASIIVGAALLATMVRVELRRERPLVDLRLFRHRLFAAATSLYGLASISYLGVLYLIALFFQNALGMSAVQSGIATFPSALGTIVGGQLVTRLLYRRLGPRRIIMAGLVVLALTCGALALVTAETNLWLVRLIMFGAGFGTVLVFIPSQIMSMATMSRAEIARATPLYNASKQLGGALGVALLTTVLAAVGATHLVAGRVVADPRAYHAGFLVAALCALASLLVAVRVPDREATATMASSARKGAA